MSKPIVFMTRGDFPGIACQLLQEKFLVKCGPVGTTVLTNDQLQANVKGVFGIYCSGFDRINRAVLDAAGPSLKVVSTFSVGYDHVDVKELKARGIRLGYTPDVLTEATAETGLALLLAVSRRIVEAYNLVLRKEWKRERITPTWFCSQGLENSTVGIIGCGRIGYSVAKKVKAFNIKTLLYTSRTEKSELAALGGQLKSIEELIKESDFIIVTLAANKETNGIINRDRINSMKSNAIFVNIARGALVDQKALTEALQNKKIAGAGLDVTDPEPIEPEDPLLKLDNVVIVPHIGSATHEARSAMAILAANNLIAVLNGTSMPADVFE